MSLNHHMFYLIFIYIINGIFIILRIYSPWDISSQINIKYYILLNY
jgi:hypothetical protein